MKTRIKSKVTTSDLSRDDVESLVNDIALLKNNERLITANMDSHLNDIRARFAAPLEQCAEQLKTKTAQLQSWAESHPDEFAKRKSIEFPSGKIGFRTGTHKLKLLSKWTWETVLAAMLEEIPFWRKYIRQKSEVDKEALIRTSTVDADPAFAVHKLKSIGLKLVQDESFFVEPNLTAVETRSTAPVETAPAQQSAAA